MPQAAHTFDTPDLPNVTAQPGRPRTRSDTHTSPAGETVPHHECTTECRLLPSGSRGWLGAVARCPPDVRKVWKLQIPSTVHTVNTLKNHTLNHLRSGAICTAIYWIFKKMSHKLQFPGESKVGGNVTEKQWSLPPPGTACSRNTRSWFLPCGSWPGPQPTTVRATTAPPAEAEKQGGRAKIKYDVSNA